MTTPDPTSKQRLRIVNNATGPEAHAGVGVGVSKDRSASASDGVTPEQAAFAALVAEADQVAVAYTLEQMGTEQLRSLAIALATQVNAAETASGEISDVGPDGICTIAVAAAAHAFGTTRDAVLSARPAPRRDRHALLRPRAADGPDMVTPTRTLIGLVLVPAPGRLRRWTRVCQQLRTHRPRHLSERCAEFV